MEKPPKVPFSKTLLWGSQKIFQWHVVGRCECRSLVQMVCADYQGNSYTLEKPWQSPENKTKQIIAHRVKVGWIRAKNLSGRKASAKVEKYWLLCRSDSRN